MVTVVPGGVVVCGKSDGWVRATACADMSLLQTTHARRRGVCPYVCGV